MTTATAEASDDWLPIPAAAKRLGSSELRIRWAVNAGRIRSSGDSLNRLVQLSAVREYLDRVSGTRKL